jgi:hypothetical protein
VPGFPDDHLSEEERRSELAELGMRLEEKSEGLLVEDMGDEKGEDLGWEGGEDGGRSC